MLSPRHRNAVLDNVVVDPVDTPELQQGGEVLRAFRDLPLRELDLSGGRSRGPVPVGANLQHLDLLLVILANVGDHLAKGGFQCIDRTLLLDGTAVILVSEIREPC